MEAQRQVNSILKFRHDAQPSNPGAYDLPIDSATNAVSEDLSPAQRKTYENVCDRMALHREVMRGSGFYHWMTSKPLTSPVPESEALSSESEPASADLAATSLRTLPTTNFLDIGDDVYAETIVEEALPEDRARFRGYLSNRPLGVGIITAGAGFGKTTAGAAATLAMEAKIGKVLCSGPTNVAIDNFSHRLFARSRAITDRYNKGKAPGDPTRRRYKLVVRAYNPVHEQTAITSLLEDPESGDNAAPTSAWKLPSKWKLPLSCAFWVLLALGSPAAGCELHPGDPVFVHELRDRIVQRKDLIPLSEVAQGTITWEAFTQVYSPKQYMGTIEGLLFALVNKADLLCVTPAASEYHKNYREWKVVTARAVAIDEAACMSRADLCCVWGNTLLPCFLFGDPRQLPPTVLTKSDTLPNTDHLVNRFSSYGVVSAMSALMASGLPVYCLKVQLRMAHGMFDLVSSVIYPDVPFTYHASRAASNPEFKVGHEIEAHLHNKFPELSAPSEATLRPVFIHCEGSRVFTDPKTGSKRSRDQVTIALDLLNSMVEKLEIDPKDVAVIAPYAANVKLINSMRRIYPALNALPDAATIDSFQGQESIITLVIMGTAHPQPGPGFTQNKQRLNVLLTRQKCALIIVGDINVANPFREDTKEPLFTVENTAGEVSFVKAPALRRIYRGLKGAGRVVAVNVKADTGKVGDPGAKSKNG
ncbi:DNA helicase [Fusarium sporotrichioides]|uniref:DNA helicase n=1 Tax=Fusarium sporotrichioides TaxID=5514 RepID=A0A395SHR3_FUSSP|nr:DNA helicase [Fusarium sporotrichioides]